MQEEGLRYVPILDTCRRGGFTAWAFGNGLLCGGFDYDTVRLNVTKIPAQWMSIIIFSLVVGLGVKLAAFLLHIWLPYAHAEAPTPISALLSPAMIGIGAYGLIRLWLELLTGNYTQYSIYINIWGLATMIYGVQWHYAG